MSRKLQRWMAAVVVTLVSAVTDTARGDSFAVDITQSFLDIQVDGLNAQQTGSDRILFTSASGLDATIDTGLETVTINSGTLVAALFGNPTALSPGVGGASGSANANAGLKDATFGAGFLAAAIRGFEVDVDSGSMAYDSLDGSFSAASISFFDFVGDLDYRALGGLFSGNEDLAGLDPVSNGMSTVGEVFDSESFAFEVFGVAEVDDPNLGTFEITLSGEIYAFLVDEDLQLQEVPEPGTIALFAFGAAVLPLAARLRRRG